MPDREKVVEHIMYCVNTTDGLKNVQWVLVKLDILRDALALLKAQEPVKPIPGLWDRDIQLYKCGACGGEIGAGGIAKYCFHCGKAVKWE